MTVIIATSNERRRGDGSGVTGRRQYRTGLQSGAQSPRLSPSTRPSRKAVRAGPSLILPPMGLKLSERNANGQSRFTTAVNPDIPGAQALSQGGDNGGLIHAPLWPTILDDQRLPMLGCKRHRWIVGQLAFACAVLIAQQGDCVLEVIPRIGGLELERFKEGRGKLAHIGISFSRQSERITGCQLPKASNFVTLAQERFPPDIRIQRGKGILPQILCAGHGINGRAEELHQLANLGLAHTPDLLLAIAGS